MPSSLQRSWRKIKKIHLGLKPIYIHNIHGAGGDTDTDTDVELQRPFKDETGEALLQGFV